MTITDTIEQIMHDVRPEGASYVVLVADDMTLGDPVPVRPLSMAAAHGPFEEWNDAMAWAEAHSGRVIPLFPVAHGE